MSLYLFEIVPAASDRASARALIAAVDEAASSVSAAVLESQVTSGHGRVFTVVEHDGDPDALGAAVREGLKAVETSEITGPDEVRLVGAEIEDIRGLRGSADYLVEWDIPAEIDMETYLTRKKANSPKYAQVPEVSFLRTYVQVPVLLRRPRRGDRGEGARGGLHSDRPPAQAVRLTGRRGRLTRSLADRPEVGHGRDE